MKKTTIKTALLTIASVSVIVALYFGVRYIIKIKNTAVLAVAQAQIISQFLQQNFPDQVKVFDASLQANNK